LIFAHITDVDSASLAPLGAVLVFCGIVIGGVLGPILFKKAGKRSGAGS